MSDDLSKVVERVQRRATEYRDILKRNEGFTRYVLIDPVLRTLGWNTADPELVSVEYNVRDNWSLGPSVDYALMAGPDKPRVFIEVKTLGGRLADAVEQCKEGVKLCTREGVSSFIVTDGQRYGRYDLVGGQFQKTIEFDIAGDTTKAVQNLVNALGTSTKVAITAEQE